jgi:hypothetical protein
LREVCSVFSIEKKRSIAAVFTVVAGSVMPQAMPLWFISGRHFSPLYRPP